MQPVVSVGKGWFDQISGKRDLELIGTTTYSGGLVFVKYRPAGS